MLRADRTLCPSRRKPWACRPRNSALRSWHDHGLSAAKCGHLRICLHDSYAIPHRSLARRLHLWLPRNSCNSATVEAGVGQKSLAARGPILPRKFYSKTMGMYPSGRGGEKGSRIRLTLRWLCGIIRGKMEKCIGLDGFVAFERVVSPYAVYCLLLKGEVVYVGKSINVYVRIGRHFQNLQRSLLGKPAYEQVRLITFDAVRVKFCSREALDREELALIQRYQPKHNVLLKRSKEVLLTPAVMDILNRVRRDAGIPPTYKKRSLTLPKARRAV